MATPVEIPKLDEEILFGFSAAVLSARYDQPKPTPKFHLDLWKLFCSDSPHVAIAAPRGHAKSTTIHAYILANVLFRHKTNVIIISNTEKQATTLLGNLKMELMENEILKEDFQINKLVKDTEAEIIVSIGKDNHLFRIMVYGSGQELRGTLWRNKRPDLIVGDDLENNETVMNAERREKFKNWFMSDVIPAVGDTGQIRIVGTILHQDSLLENFLKDTSGFWLTARYAAHNDDFSEILWPEKFSKERLLGLRNNFIAQGMPDTYAREYLNNPISAAHAFFQKEDFRKLENGDEPLTYYITTDLALTKKAKSDYVVFVVGGVNNDGMLKIVNVVREKMDSMEIVNKFFELSSIYRPDIFTIEGGAISKAILPVIYAEMPKRNIFQHIKVLPPIDDKKLRAQAIRVRMRAGGVQFDKEAHWFPDFIQELLEFDKGKHDDQVDALAWLGIILDKMIEAPTREEYEREQEDEEYENSMYVGDDNTGIDFVGGY